MKTRTGLSIIRGSIFSLSGSWVSQNAIIDGGRAYIEMVAHRNIIRTLQSHSISHTRYLSLQLFEETYDVFPFVSCRCDDVHACRDCLSTHTNLV